jgi:membrane-associated protein
LDSRAFAATVSAGALASLGTLNVWLLFLLLALAAVLGDSANYGIGKRIGHRAFDGSVKFLKQEHLKKTEAFYEKHGKKTIILARFVPIVRTFAPFVAGVGSMTYGTFLAYNVVGGVAWVAICVFSGYFFGNIPVVKKNFSLVVLAIIGISVLPLAWEWWKARKARGGSAA